MRPTRPAPIFLMVTERAHSGKAFGGALRLDLNEAAKGLLLIGIQR